MPDPQLSHALEGEINETLERLLSSAGDVRRQAAHELHRLGVRSRGSIRPRGSLQTPSRNKLPQREKLTDLITCLNDEQANVICQVAAALGEWGDEHAAAALDNLLRSSGNVEVQLYCITALRMIGGARSLGGLAWALDHGTSAVRDAAVTAIEELATGGRRDDSEPASRPASAPETGAFGDAVQTRGGVRTRGAAGAAPRAVDHIQSSLKQIFASDDQSDYLRHRAQKVFDLLEQD